ncbi:MAG: lysozyme family protein [Lachnospiraceae bacterium]|nr:lysozyme family protein [Lachnospiraceae bacterium]
MGKEIRTRQIHKDIKVLDKAVTGTERIKRAYVRTKDSAEQTRNTEYATPVDYAESKISNSADTAAHETAHQTWKQGKKALNGIKDTIHQPKEHIRKRGQELAKKKAVQAKSLRQQSIRTLERGEKTIKTAEYSGQAVKNTGKGTVKYAKRTVKTAEQTARTTVKTTQKAARNARIAAETSVKTAEKAAAAARQAARTAAQSVRAAARATVAAVRAIIAATKALISAIWAGGWIAVLILVIVILFGGVLCMVGGGNSNTVTPVSTEVEAYEPLIRKYANQYGIGEYVELLKAVMMQESGGRGLDPMQSSEGAFNTKYPRQPNGITDPEYSIACGVQELKSCLERAGVENPVDMDNIKLALQAYNFGNGYISWAREHYGGYTMSNAAEFSDMMAERMGWENYGDKQYVPHVLRYYVFGRIPTGIGNQAIVQVALSQEGNAGGQPYWSWYGFNKREEWCACFVSWCADQCGYIESGVIPKFAKCTVGAEWFQSHGQWQDGSYVPKAGDIIFFIWSGDTETNHVGIVERVENGVVYTVEGNSGDKVATNSYSVGSSVIYGYGIPAY